MANGINIQISANDVTGPAFNSARKNLESVKSCVEDVGSSLKTMQNVMTGALAVFAGGGVIGGFAKSLLDAGMQAERLGSKFSAATGSVRLGAAELDYAKQQANRLGLEYVALADNYASFVAASKGSPIEGDGARKIFTSVSEASAALKLSSDETKGALTALSQMMSKGTVQAEELKGQLGERLPGAFRLAAVAMNMTTQELQKNLEAGKILASDLLPKLADQLHRVYGQAATESANSAQAALNRFNNTLTETKTAMGQAILPTFTSGLELIKNNLDNIKTAVVLLGETALAVFAGKIVGSVSSAITAHNLEKAAIAETIAMLEAKRIAALAVGPAPAGGQAAALGSQVALLQQQERAMTLAGRASTAFGSAMAMLGGPIGVVTLALGGLYIAYKKWLDVQNEAIDKKNAPDALDKLRTQLELEKEVYDIQREKMGLDPKYRKDTAGAQQAAETSEYMKKQIADLSTFSRQMQANAAFPNSPEYTFAARQADQVKANIKAWNLNRNAINEVKTATQDLKKEDKAREDAKKAAEDAEKTYLEDVKNNIANVKEQASAIKDLGKARLDVANDSYKESLEQELRLYERGEKSISALRRPLEEYGKLANSVFSERYDGHIEAFNRLGAQYDEYIAKVKSKNPTKEIRQAGLDILAEMKNQAQSAIQIETDKYRDMLGKAKNHYDDLKKLILAKEDEIRAVKSSIADRIKSDAEKDRIATGNFAGGYEYLDPNNDALTQRQAMIDKLRRDEASAMAMVDPAKQQAALEAVTKGWGELTGAVSIAERKIRTVSETSDSFSIFGFIKDKEEVVESLQTVISQENAISEVRSEQARIDQRRLELLESQKSVLEKEKEAAKSAMDEWASQVQRLEGLLERLNKDITINLKINGLDQVDRISNILNMSGAGVISGVNYPPVGSVDTTDYSKAALYNAVGADVFNSWVDPPARANGGPVEPYATYRINENGTEYLTMGNKGGYVSPAGQAPIRADKPTTTSISIGDIRIELPNITKVSDREADEIARAVFLKIKQYSSRFAA